jgi:glycosyltransferase involved in cell wall biosynthesis
LFIKNLDGGGVQKVILSLAEALGHQGYQVDLVLSHAAGAFLNQVPDTVKLVTLRAAPSWAARKAVVAAAPKDLAALLHVSLPMKSTHTLRYLPDLVRYLRQERPLALLAAEPRLNCEAVWARRLAQGTTRLAVSEHLHLSRSKFGSARWRKPYLPHLLRRTYMAADAIIAVSDGVADDLAASTGIPRTRIMTIYNPVVTPELQTKAQEPLDHPWFVPGAPPVLLSVGRLSRQKDFSTLLRAFARLRMTYAEQNVRLLVLGEGPQRRQLEALIRQLGLGASVDLPGFVDNPFA